MGGWGRALCGWGRARGLARLLSLSWGGVWWGGMCGCFVGGCLGDGTELCGWGSGLAHLLSLHWGGVCGGCWRGGLGRSLLWGRGLLLLVLVLVLLVLRSACAAAVCGLASQVRGVST